MKRAASAKLFVSGFLTSSYVRILKLDRCQRPNYPVRWGLTTFQNNLANPTKRNDVHLTFCPFLIENSKKNSGTGTYYDKGPENRKLIRANIGLFQRNIVTLKEFSVIENEKMISANKSATRAPKVNVLSERPNYFTFYFYFRE